MIARAVLVVVTACLCSARVGGAQQDERQLAAGSLSHSARSLGHLPKDQALRWVRRIRVLLEQAERLWPDHVEVNRQLFDLYQRCGQPGRAARAGRRYLLARPKDYAVGVRWIRLCQVGLGRAEDRIAALRDVVAERRLDDAIRAVASAELAGIYMRQGLRAEALKECARALKLDPHQPRAIAIRAELAKGRTAADRLADVLALFQADPGSARSAWAVARLLQRLGLYAEALEYYKHADEVARVRMLSVKDFEQFVVDYLNAMLDAGRAEMAVVQFEPIARRYRGRLLPLQALMWEGYRTLGKAEQAKAVVEVMEQTYNRRWADRERLTGPELAEIAWFHVLFSPDATRALRLAQEALKRAPDDPFVQRVMGAAELAAGKAAEGVRRLRPLVERDAFAAVSLVRHFVSTNRVDEARKVVAAAGAPGRPRSGMAWRELRRVAEANRLPLPPAPDTAPLRKILQRQPEGVFEMGKTPEKFLALSLTPAGNEVVPGEPVVVRIELKNISTQPVPLGERGVLKPAVFLSLEIKGDSSRRWDFPHMLSAELPAPRYLPPAHGTALNVRIDVGVAEEVLMTHPLERLTITVRPLLDPIQLGRKLYPSAPGIKAEPVTIVRRPLVDLSGGPAAGRAALSRIVRDLRQGNLAVRMRAARQTAALLAHVRATELGKARPVLPEVLNKPMLLRMTSAFLQADAPLVRAEMLAALRFVRLEEPIIALTAPCVEDASALVRGRLIELLAGQRTRGHQTLLKLYARDPDRFVRDMAAAVAGG